MKFLSYTILLKEIPGKVSLCFSMTGCPIRCEGCHSAELWNGDNGKESSLENIVSIAKKYDGFFDTILFFGGEWNGEAFIGLTDALKSLGYSVSLFTGSPFIKSELEKNLDFLKLGPYIKTLGGLESPTTNQRLYDFRSGSRIDITETFWKNP